MNVGYSSGKNQRLFQEDDSNLSAIVDRYRIPILAGTVVAFVLIWEIIAMAVNNSLMIAGPVQTGQDFVQLIYNPDLQSRFLFGSASTLSAIFAGFALAAVIGLPVGILMGRYLIVDYALDPWVNAWYSIPAIAFVALTMNWTGLSVTSAIVVAFLIGVFNISINCYTGVKNVSKSLVETAMSFSASQGTVLRKVILPAALPDIMVGLRLGITRAIDGVIISEMVFAGFGLGGLIFNAADRIQLGFANLFILVLAGISIILNEAMKYINRRLVAWKEASAMARE